MAKRTNIEVAHDHLKAAYRALRRVDPSELIEQIPKEAKRLADVRSAVLIAECDLYRLIKPRDPDMNEHRARQLKWKNDKWGGGWKIANYEPIGAIGGWGYEIRVRRRPNGKFEREPMFFEDRYGEPKYYPTRLAAATDAIRLATEDWQKPVEDEEEAS